MVLTDQRPMQEEKAVPGRPPRYRKRLVVVVAALLVLIAVPAVAVFFDGPPLGRDFPEGEAGVVTYGADDGVGEDCAWRMTFDPTGVPFLAGGCGVLRLEDGQFRLVDETVRSFGLMDIAVAPDGTIWLADVDGPVKSIAGETVSSHNIFAFAVEVTADGAVWALPYGGPYGPDVLPVLMRFDGSAFVEVEAGPFDALASAPDGSLYTISQGPEYSSASGVTTEALSVIGRMSDGLYTTQPIPEGFEGGSLTVAPDGALWMIGDTGRVIDRGGVTDSEWVLIRYDGTEVSTILAPFPEPNDLAIHPDGTVWVSSSLYGAFAYDGSKWVQYGVEKGLLDEAVNFIEIGPDGSVYVGSRLGVTQILPDGS